ncbi:MAG TPA: hypothetical protein VFQ85_10785 [Mycobacteriales bacterium]|nr:hypothetical protein [Mycobacteriales bacterium]
MTTRGGATGSTAAAVVVAALALAGCGRGADGAAGAPSPGDRPERTIPGVATPSRGDLGMDPLPCGEVPRIEFSVDGRPLSLAADAAPVVLTATRLSTLTLTEPTGHLVDATAYAQSAAEARAMLHGAAAAGARIGGGTAAAASPTVSGTLDARAAGAHAAEVTTLLVVAHVAPRTSDPGCAAGTAVAQPFPLRVV